MLLHKATCLAILLRQKSQYCFDEKHYHNAFLGKCMENQKGKDFLFFRCAKMSMILSTFLITRLVKAFSTFRASRQFRQFWPKVFRAYVFSLRRQLNERSAEHEVAGITLISCTAEKMWQNDVELVHGHDFCQCSRCCRKKLEKIAFLLELNPCLIHKTLELFRSSLSSDGLSFNTARAHIISWSSAANRSLISPITRAKAMKYVFTRW